MNHPQLDQAREWAEDIFDAVANGFPVTSSAQDAAQFVKSLPDQWIDAEKVAELADDMANWSLPDMPSTTESGCRHLIEIMGGFADRINDLLTPTLPTLAELIEQGNEWHKYLRFQCDVGGDRAGVVGIVSKDVFWISYDSGFTIQAVASQITPRPDLPRLEWPGSTPDDVAYATGGALTMQDVVDECRAVRKERANTAPPLPRPEDVPEGEPWTVRHDNGEWVGVRSNDSRRPWSITRMDGMDYRDVDDPEITLVSRLVQEDKP